MQPSPTLPTEPGPTLPLSAVHATRAPTARAVRSVHRSRLERRSAVVLVGLVVGLWLLVVFANALADASAQTARLAREQALNDALKARLAAGSAEIALVRGRPFQEFLARGYGMGLPAERTFALAPGAPPPRPLVPLGHREPTAVTTTPLEDWLDLLLGT